MTIVSHAATDDYRAGWERVFGKPRFVPADEYRGDTTHIGHVEYFSFGDGRQHYEPIGDEV